jgi:hypothetical protein
LEPAAEASAEEEEEADDAEDEEEEVDENEAGSDEDGATVLPRSRMSCADSSSYSARLRRRGPSA